MSDDLKKIFGEEYPEVIQVLGQRMTVSREDRFTRYYAVQDGTHRSEVSRLEDGSAAISLAELRRDWPTWSQRERLDFSRSCNGLRKHPEYPDMLRFLAQENDHVVWSCIALQLASFLPPAEAFALLLRMLRNLPSHTANVTQALAATGHPEASAVLSAHLGELWGRADLWDDDPFLNWTAFDATCCIGHLLQLGGAPGDFEEKARRLAAHHCAGNRGSCSTFLSSYYDWIPKADLPAG